MESRAAYFEPTWFREETNRLADEWYESKSKLGIIEYVLKNASKRYLEEYKRAKKIFDAAS